MKRKKKVSQNNKSLRIITSVANFVAMILALLAAMKFVNKGMLLEGGVFLCLALLVRIADTLGDIDNKIE